MYMRYGCNGSMHKCTICSIVCPEMVGTIIVIIALAIVYEALKSLREYLMARDTRRRKKGKSANINTNATHDKTHLLSSTVQEPHWWVVLLVVTHILYTVQCI